ncbi:MAG: ATP-grasp domain-containing protein [Armatimonadetes bacterium]|nr:ATP-grasp domain-containing protein [Armatimonadota bacterium]
MGGGCRGKVLVLGRGLGPFLAVVRSLSRGGLEVHSAWCDPDRPESRSRHLHRLHSVAEFSPGSGRWWRELRELTRHERFDLLIPIGDRVQLPLSEHRSELPVPVAMAAPEALEVVWDKRKTGELARSLGIPTPPEILAERSTPAGAADELRWPLFAKPLRSRTPQDLPFRVPVCRLETAHELRALLNSLAMGERILLQQGFPGTGVGVEALARDGEVLFAFQHERIRESVTQGSSYRRAVALDPELLGATGRLLKALRYTGVAMAEYRRNPETGSFALLEVNGRFWGSLPLAVASGADFPLFLYESMVEGRVSFPAGYRTGIYARKLPEDLDPMRRQLAARPGIVLEEARRCLTLREKVDSLTWDDPEPGFHRLAGVPGEQLSELGDRWRPVLFHWGPIRRRLRARLLACLLEARRILFLGRCNLMRSAFAEHCARLRFGSAAEFSSAGTDREEGWSPSPAARQAAAELGVELSGHRSRRLTPELAAGADLILVFWEGAFRELPRSRELLGRVHRFGLLAPTGELEVPAPSRRSVTELRRTFDGIARTLEWAARERM